MRRVCVAVIVGLLGVFSGACGESGANGPGGPDGSADSASDSGSGGCFGVSCPAGTHCEPGTGCVPSPACSTIDHCLERWRDDACKSDVSCDPVSALCTFQVLDNDRDLHPPPVCGGDDCDDSSSLSLPGLPEICDGRDNDCDGDVDELATCPDGQSCERGACSCSGGLTACGAACVDTTRDASHCGGCNSACRSGLTCDAGRCGCPDCQGCCSGRGACFVRSELPPEQQSLWDIDTCPAQNACAPTELPAGGGFGFVPCTTGGLFAPAPGVCVPACFIPPDHRDLMVQSSCGADELCAPCINPLDEQTPTGVCP